MQTFKIDFILRALKPIVHNGGELYGNTALFRRIKIVTAESEVVSLPVVSGNAVRGSMRDYCALKFLRALEKQSGEKVALPIDAFHLLFSGGALKEASTAGDIDFARKIRAAIPVVSLFGGAYGNTIYPGKIKIGFLIPVVKEALHLIPPDMRPGAEDVPSMHEIMSLDMYTRKDDANDENKRTFLSDNDDLFDSNQMIYYSASVAAGTNFYWQVSAADLTEEEAGILFDCLKNIEDVSIGGKSAVGYGTVSVLKQSLTLRQSEALDITEERIYEDEEALAQMLARAKEAVDFMRKL